MADEWIWDESLFLGSAPYYVQGRLPYAPALAEELVRAVPLDRQSRVVEVGCGPAIVLLAVAPFVGEAVGIDPDPGMLAEARRRAEAAGAGNVRVIQAHGEQLPLDLGEIDAAIFARSFHWMDRPLVAGKVFAMLRPGGAFVHVSSPRDEGSVSAELPFPAPPSDAIRALIVDFLGPERRAGQGVRSSSPGNEAGVLRPAGFVGPELIQLPAVSVLERSEDDLVALVFSRSGSAPHLFGDRRAEFERDLRQLLRQVSPSGRFAEHPPDTDLFIWRKPAT